MHVCPPQTIIWIDRLGHSKKVRVEKIFEVKMSGKSMENREELQKAVSFLREKDVLILESLDRLGRNYDNIGQMEQLLDRKEIGLIVLNLPILNQ